MKLNNVIIMNRRHMKEFFSFSDFWSQRKEFKDVSNNDMFFKHKDKENHKNQLKAQVLNWIEKRNLTSQMQLSQSNTKLPSCCVTRVYSTDCESELSLLKPEEAFGVVCLYEMMERKLKQDIYEILACLGYETFNPQTGIILVSNNSTKEFNQDIEEDNEQNEGLSNVLIVNQSTEKSGEAIIRFDNKEYSISSGECLRALFLGNRCIKILPRSINSIQFILNAEQHTTGLSLNGANLRIDGDVTSFTAGAKGYIYAVKSKNKKFIASHTNIADDYYYNPIGENENIVYVELNNNETECLLLTNEKKLYLCKADSENEILFIDKDVIMATFENNNLEILK